MSLINTFRKQNEIKSKNKIIQSETKETQMLQCRRNAAEAKPLHRVIIYSYCSSYVHMCRGRCATVDEAVLHLDVLRLSITDELASWVGSTLR